MQPTEPIGHRFLDSFAELCECQGLYLGQWYRALVTGVNGDGARLLYLDRAAGG